MMPVLRFLTANLWSILSGTLSLYFLWVFHEYVGFPPSETLTPTSAIYPGLFVLFFLALIVQHCNRDFSVRKSKRCSEFPRSEWTQDAREEMFGDTF